MAISSRISTESGTQISIPLGIAIGLLASFIQSLGLTIQRKSHVLNHALPEGERKAEYRRPLWLLGFGIFISSNLFGSIFQIASLPVVILAPLGAVSLLWNAFFARILLGDVFSPWMIIGTLLIAGGAVLIGIFGIVAEPTHSLEDLLRLFNRPTFVVYFSLLAFVVVVCLGITHVAEYYYVRRIALPSASPPLSPLIAPTTAPTILTTAVTTSSANPEIATERTPLLDRKLPVVKRSRSPLSDSDESSTSRSIFSFVNSNSTPVILAASYASSSGIISGMCLLFAKSGVELLVLTFGGDNQFWRWQAWVLVLALAVCALLQLWYMHKSLVLADPTLICPLAFCFYNLSSILNGLVYFDQFSALSTLQLWMVILGITVLLAGVWVVSFPSIGGGIDVGPWAEDEGISGEHLEMDVGSVTSPTEDDEEQEIEMYEDEPLPMHGPSGEPSGAVVKRNGRFHFDSIPDLCIVTEPPGPISSPCISTPAPSPRSAHPRLQTDSALFGSRTRRSQTAYVPDTVTNRPSRSSISRRRTTLAAAGLSDEPHPFPNPLSPGPSNFGAGFSIGLSPVSPGFVLVPRDRRRRLTGGGLLRNGTSTDSDPVREARRLNGDVEGGRRRVVSDGALGASSAGRLPQLPAAYSDGDLPHGEQDSLLPTSNHQPARQRWAWLRGIITGGKR
ncbi:hypothetical protein CERSUDRAFT_110614 [Gelatoporia subvermispora B]|uniref:Magnesium transporter n=1 Tax=Ceriporiopsis subvermispora (strain B) TaxID=914234 RepID=M2PYT6_CERS8|nr:hypothetical protein CERSUDRAFT_110614 [Gelatoporia subvermispora B]